MITTLVDLDLEKPGVIKERTVRVGDIFPIVLYVEHGGGDSEVLFDTLILELFFNDSTEAIVRVDPTDRPVAGELVRRQKRVSDAFRAQELTAPERLTFESARSATPLSLFGFASSEPAGPYLGRSGRAGIRSLDEPFRLGRGDAAVSVAMGKATAGLQAARSGRTRIIANGLAFLNGETIPIRSTPSVLTVQG